MQIDTNAVMNTCFKSMSIAIGTGASLLCVL